MRIQRLIIAMTSLVVALSVLAPAPAGAAGPLLSGYGGPGDGSQALLGATLLGGSSGSSGSGGEAGATSSLASTEGAPVTTTRAGALPAGRRSARHGHGAGPQAERGSAQAPAGGGTSGSYALSNAHRNTAGSQAFGLTETDLLYIFLAVAALALTGVLMWRLTHGRTAPWAPAKAMPRGTRVSG